MHIPNPTSFPIITKSIVCMAYEQEQPALPFDNNEDDDLDEHDDMNMPSSIMSFGEPDLDETALQIALLAIILVMENDDDDDYEYVDYMDLYIPIRSRTTTSQI
ncbi:hypothetical protein BGZ91_009058 [Linnemannia elongata]|nr:hypothetical protein BGZ91_009058 [Linnemannia elongata]KAG0062460.1 hypothetical protein BGZ90_003077 [Linnemannia elongata]